MMPSHRAFLRLIKFFHSNSTGLRRVFSFIFWNWAVCSSVFEEVAPLVAKLKFVNKGGS